MIGRSTEMHRIVVDLIIWNQFLIPILSATHLVATVNDHSELQSIPILSSYAAIMFLSTQFDFSIT